MRKMYDNYKDKFPISADSMILNHQEEYRTNPYKPYMPGANVYEIGGKGNLLTQAEYTDWRDESLSWHLTCSIHDGLNPLS
jgi:hypothetical protein